MRAPRPILHSRCDDSTAAVLCLLTCCQSHILLSPPGPSVVTSPRAPRQFLQCLGMFSCKVAAVLGRPGRSFQNRPARAPPHPLPHVAVSPFHLQASPIHAGLFSSSVRLSPLPTRHFPLRLPSSHPSRSQLSSKLSSAREEHTHTLSLSSYTRVLARTRTSAAYSYGGRHGTAGPAWFIHSTLL